MGTLKLVVAGPVGTGKTTFIGALSEIPVVETEALATEDLGKPTTTVGLDFGLLTLDGVTLHLYGTPGQDRFDFMWDILMQGAAGFLLLVAGDRPGDFPKARAIMDFLTSRFPVPYLLGVTRQDLPRVWTPEEVAFYFGLGPEEAVGLVATDPRSARSALAALFRRVVGGLERKGG